MNYMPYITLILVVVFAYIFINSISTKINQLDYSELTKELSNGNVTELVVTPKSGSGIYVLTGKLKDYGSGETFTVSIPYTDTVISAIYNSAEEQGLAVKTNSNPE